LKSVTFGPDGEAKVLVESVAPDDKIRNLSFIPFGGLNPEDPAFTFHFIDKDGVTIKTVPYLAVEGDLKRLKKGDGFRFVLRLPDAALLKQTAKVDLRPSHP
jgi:hypothetical protein